MNQRRWGLWLAFASLAVNAPRLMLVYIKADGILPARWVEATVISLSGVANGIVLAGAGIVIAHTLAQGRDPNVHRAVRPLMLVAWLLSLVFATALITPAFVSGLRGETLAKVLSAPWLQWTWSAVAVIAVEVAAAGSMLADAALNARSKSQSRPTVREEQTVKPLRVACEVCGKSLNNTQNARNAHQRFCKGRRAAVGQT